jgi:hypothetical protein
MLRNFAAASLFLLSLQSVLAADVEVDVELVLAVDVSRSMSPRELEIRPALCGMGRRWLAAGDCRLDID